MLMGNVVHVILIPFSSVLKKEKNNNNNIRGNKRGERVGKEKRLDATDSTAKNINFELFNNKKKEEECSPPLTWCMCVCATE